jgi:sterol desaturase/sphingolipid hydroxylase (fatty acid hydroxylase superfamily)
MLEVLVPIAAFFFVFEFVSPARPQPILRRGVLVDALYVPLHYVLRVALNVTLAKVLMDAGQRFLPPWSVHVLADKPVWLQAAAVIFVLDFFFYVMHRFKHRWSWWWRLHETHHSSPRLDWLASARFHPLEKILDRVVFLLPLLVLGVSDTAILIWASVDVFFGMMNHANIRLRLGPLIYVFVGPEMHRWHHARDEKLSDCNFGNNLSIFDWAFGTAYLAPGEPRSFGIDEPDYPQADLWRQCAYAFRPGVRAARRALAPAPRASASASQTSPS